MSSIVTRPTVGFSSGKVPKRQQASAVLAAVAAEASTGLEHADTDDQSRSHLSSILKLVGEASATGVSVAVAASLLKVSQPTVREWVHRGILEATAGESPLQISSGSLGEALAAIVQIRAAETETRLAGAVLQLVQDRRTRRQLASRLEELSQGDVVELSSNDIVFDRIEKRATGRLSGRDAVRALEAERDFR